MKSKDQLLLEQAYSCVQLNEGRFIDWIQSKLNAGVNVKALLDKAARYIKTKNPDLFQTLASAASPEELKQLIFKNESQSLQKESYGNFSFQRAETRAGELDLADGISNSFFSIMATSLTSIGHMINAIAAVEAIQGAVATANPTAGVVLSICGTFLLMLKAIKDKNEKTSKNPPAQSGFMGTVQQ